MSEDAPIRVMVVDDHAMVRRGLSTILKVRSNLALVGEAGNGEEAVQMCERAQPDVVLMDLVMPEMSGVEATRAIRERWPQVQVIALTSFHDKELVREALQAGAIGYLLKNVSADDLAEAIHGAHLGRSTLAPEAIQSLIRADSPVPGYQEPSSQKYGLTAREVEVLGLMVQGLSNLQIAERLVVSRSTAKAHVSNILSKLGVSNRAEAIVVALRSNVGTRPSEHS